MKLKNRLFTFAATMAATTLMFTQLWATSLSFVPSASTIGVDESTSVDIVIDGLSFLDDLTAFQFVISFDETVLSIDSYSFGIELGTEPQGTFPDYIDDSEGYNGHGNFELAQTSFLMDFSGQHVSDSFILATLTITGLGPGKSTLGFSNVILGDFWGELIDASFANSDITVAAPVPEPATMLLFGAGILALAGFRRNSSIKKTAKTK